MNLDRNVDRLVNQLKRDKSVLAVYLFGSHGTRRETPLSDVDICVFTKTTTKSDILNIKSFGSDKFDISLFDTLPIYLKSEVFKGKPLFVRDRYFIAEKFAQSFRQYQDFKKYERGFWDAARKKALA
ncbi:nucleotidyltransferase domain-containing protein [Candidatus Woesearchaeota archaeon]|nr:nucleotidyltransferase domain-containing protein [Candidatus Woesearchaeota archaeon]